MRRPKLWVDLRRGQRGGWPVKPVGRFLVEETGGLRLVPTSNTLLGFVPAFDGNQVLYQQNNPAHGQPITLAALCYPTTNETVAVSWGVAGGPSRTQLKVQDSGGGYTHNFQLVDSGATLLEVTSGVNDSPLNIPWLMVGVSASPTSHRSYLNGRLVASSGSSLTLQTTCNQFGVGGRDNSGWGLKFQGSIAWAGVWDAALSFSEVQELWTLSLQYGYVPSATPSYYFITGRADAGAEAISCAPGVGTALVNGAAPKTVVHLQCRVPAATVRTIAQTPTLVQAHVVRPATATVVSAGLVLVAARTVVTTPAAATVVLTPRLEVLTVAVLARPGPSAVAVVGLAPAVRSARVASPASATVVIASTAAIRSVLSSVVKPPAATIALTPFISAARVAARVTPAQAVTICQGLVPLIRSARISSPGMGVIRAVTAAPQPRLELSISVSRGTVLGAGIAPTVTVGAIARPAMGQVTVAGSVGTLVYEAQWARPSSDVAAGGWTPSTGVDLYACVDETTPDDGDWISSPVEPVASAAILAVSTLMVPAAGTVTLRIRHRWAA